MNSVALPAAATGSALGAEVDLIRRAARGDGESFEELYRRHSQVAWRFGQAVATDSDAAVKAVAEGFGRALRGLRRRSRMDAEGFRPFVLAAIYRAAVDNLHSYGAPAPVASVGRSSAAAKGRSSKSRSADAAFVEAAFRSLPERWRAAIWLSEVEALSEDRIAPILGVSSAVAAQLVSRGRRGLVGRFEQGRRPVPAHLDAALRPLSATVPAGLGTSVGERWATLVNDPAARFAPISAWMADRAVRPLWVSVGGLMGLSLIGLGIVGQGTGLNGGPVAGGAAYGNANPPGINPAGAFARGFSPIAAGSGLNAFNLTSLNGGGSTGSGGFGGSTAPGYGGGYTPPGGGNTTTPTTGGPTPPPNNPGSGLPILNQLPPPPPPSTVTTLLPSNPVVNVSSSGSTNTVQLLPTSSGSTGSVTTCSSDGLGLTVGTVSYGCTPVTSNTTNTTDSTSSTNTLSGTLSTITSGL